MTYLLDYDLYLIRKHLKIEDADNVVPIPANAPEYFRIYFSTLKGELPLGIVNPGAKELLFLKSLAYTCGGKGDSLVFVIRHSHIVEVLTLDSWGLLYALSALLVNQNVLQPLFADSVHRIMNAWPELLEKIGLPPDASDEDILNFLYKDKS
ncbi:MAG: hypothetical protein Q8M92_07870 [Candidatus Subteraquimicrobiales bacterium]|nr:hypothetical protein [Candidatus Subteraquimicrobiales bacterium]